MSKNKNDKCSRRGKRKIKNTKIYISSPSSRSTSSPLQTSK